MQGSFDLPTSYQRLRVGVQDLYLANLKAHNTVGSYKVALDLYYQAHAGVEPATRLQFSFDDMAPAELMNEIKRVLDPLTIKE